MEKIINYSFDKQKAIMIAKKAVSGKFAIMKDEGDTFKVGAPMMTATIKIDDKTITVSGKGGGGPIATTCASEIEMAVQEYQEKATSSNPSSSNSNDSFQNNDLDNQTKIVAVLREYKGLYDDGIITKEEFEEKKKEILHTNHSLNNEKQPVVQEIKKDDETTKEPTANNSEKTIDLGNAGNNTLKTENKKMAAWKQFLFLIIPFAAIVGSILCFIKFFFGYQGKNYALYVLHRGFPLLTIMFIVSLLMVGFSIAIFALSFRYKKPGLRIIFSATGFIISGAFIPLMFFVYREIEIGTVPYYWIPVVSVAALAFLIHLFLAITQKVRE